MSYCRWSSDNGRCDLYVYEDVSGGWTTHVARRRKLFAPIPALPLSWLAAGGKTRKGRLMRWMWMKSYRLHAWSVSLIPFRNLNLPCDGESFNDPTPGACADRLEELRRLGYHVPQRAIDRLREEAASG